MFVVKHTKRQLNIETFYNVSLPLEKHGQTCTVNVFAVRFKGSALAHKKSLVRVKVRFN